MVEVEAEAEAEAEAGTLELRDPVGVWAGAVPWRGSGMGGSGEGSKPKRSSRSLRSLPLPSWLSWMVGEVWTPVPLLLALLLALLLLPSIGEEVSDGTNTTPNQWGKTKSHLPWLE